MVYLFTKTLARVSFLGAYRKVYIINEDNIPWDRAALLACNHPNGFVEPLVMASNMPHPIHYIARGDVFEKKITGWFLRKINLIPIFRFKDGFASLRKNEAHINKSLETLGDKNQLMIFAEGSTEQVRHIRPIQKGTIRLAFDTLHNYPDSRPVIIPSVIHFTDFNYYRTEVYIDYGTPIEVADYQELYLEHKAKAIRVLLADVTKAMQDLLVTVPPEIELRKGEELLKIVRAKHYEDKLLPIVQKVKSVASKEEELRVSKRLVQLSDEKRNRVFEKVEKLKTLVEKYNISYLELADKNSSGIMTIIGLVLGFVPFLLGTILHAIPIKMSKMFMEAKVNKVEFTAVIKLCAFLMFYPAFLLVYAIVIGIVNIKLIWIVLLFPILGWFTFVYREMWDALSKKGKSKGLSIDQKIELDDLYSSIHEELEA